jgi:hypothetical protein
MVLHITSNSKSLSIQPTSKDELRSIIEQEIKRQGPDADLNFIDTSKITDMSYLFRRSYHKVYVGDSVVFYIRDIKIDQWDVSNVTNMYRMFSGQMHFNCDLSNWDVRNVENLDFAFHGCSKLKCDLSEWKPCAKHISWVTFDGCDCMPIEFRLQLR